MNLAAYGCDQYSNEVRRGHALRWAWLWVLVAWLLPECGGTLGMMPLDQPVLGDENQDRAAQAARQKEEIRKRQQAILDAEEQDKRLDKKRGTDSEVRFEAKTRAEKCEMLDMLAEKSQANFDKIVTWTGEYKIVDMYSVNGEYVKLLRLEKPPPGVGPWTRQDTGTVHFTLDSPNQSVYTSIEVTDSAMIRDGKDQSIDFRLPLTSPQRTILTGSKYLSFVPTDKWPDFVEVPAMKGQIGRVAFRDPIEKAEEDRYSSVVDPRHFYQYARYFWDECRFFSTLLKDDKTADLAAWDKGVHVLSFGEGDEKTYLMQLSFTGKPNDPSTLRVGAFTFSPKFGFNLTSYTTTNADGKIIQSVNWEWKEENGVFIPTKITRKNYQKDTGAVTLMRLLELTSSELNKPVAASNFELSRLGLKDGERLMDRVEQVCYTYQGGELTKPVKFGAMPEVASVEEVTGNSQSRRNWTLILTNGLIVVVACGVLVWRKLAKTAQPLPSSSV